METGSTNWEHSDTSTLTSALSGVEQLEEIPGMAAGTVAAVVVFVLVSIGVVFTLGVLLDCRQQKVLEKKLKAFRSRRRPGAAVSVDLESENSGFASHMEPAASSLAPAVLVLASSRAT